MDGKIRRSVWERASGRCEISGLQLGPADSDRWECHHRRNKGMGGTSRENVDSLTNLLALNPRVHNGGPLSVHGRRAWSQKRGYLIPKDVSQPGMWPLWLLGRRWVLLTDSGVYAPLPIPKEAPDADHRPTDLQRADAG
jgi:hypothetical protein